MLHLSSYLSSLFYVLREIEIQVRMSVAFSLLFSIFARYNSNTRNTWVRMVGDMVFLTFAGLSKGLSLVCALRYIQDFFFT